MRQEFASTKGRDRSNKDWFPVPMLCELNPSLLLMFPSFADAARWLGNMGKKCHTETNITVAFL